MVQQGSEWSVGDALGGAWADATVLRFGEADLPDVVYIAQLTSALYLEKR